MFTVLKRMTFCFISIFLIQFFSPNLLFSQGDALFGPRVNQIIRDWINKENAKLLPSAYKTFPSNNDQRSVQEDSLYIPWGEMLLPHEAQKLGIKLKIDISKSVGIAKPYFVKLEDVEEISLADRKYLLANYRDKDSNCPSLYFLSPTGPELLLSPELGCNEIHFLQPGKKAPAFVLERTSGCANGSQDVLYSIEKNGQLKALMPIGDWFGEIFFANLDDQGNFDVVSSENVWDIPKDLEAQLKKEKNFNEETSGPIMRLSEILKWDGNKLIKVGEYYGFEE